MTNAEIASVFDELADLLEFQGANPFRIRAYRNAARVVGDYPEPVAELVSDSSDSLTQIEGVGKDLADKIKVLVQTNSLPLLEELRSQIPESVLAMMRVPGLGPKRAATIFKDLKVATLDQLRAACESGKVRELKGFGAKIESAILQGIDIAAEADLRILWAEADEYARELLAHLKTCTAAKQLEVAGSYRRRKETVGDLDILVVADDPDQVMDCLASFPGLAEVLLRGDTKMAVRLTSKLHVDLRVVPDESFGAALQYFTGSQAHNIVLRGMAKDRSLKINEYGVFSGKKQIAGRTEEDVYAALDLPWFPPELREARREFDWARAGQLPELITVDDIRGDLHSHTNWTDGINTLEEMAEAAKRRGLKYLAITDHSKRVTMVGGLHADRLRQQWALVDQFNKHQRGFTLLKGVEVDILEQGGLDLPDDVLSDTDWVVASVHFGQSQSRDRITGRIVDALANPYVCAIAHPTGRLLTRRKAYEVDLEKVFAAAAEHGKCLELNAHPSRLDLDDVACAAAKGHGIPIVISTDAHSIDGLAAMRYGVNQARRAGLTAHDVANTRTWAQLKKQIRRP
jgi:DNA polymerase (family 10)